MKPEINILLVEDNEGDIILTLQALEKAQVSNGIQVARDGEEALQYLWKKGKFKDVSTPDLILLDINLPKIDGKEVLAEIKKDKALMVIPVVMLTTSDSEKDILESYYNHANCFITKPVDFQKFMQVISTIKDFWVSIVKLPKSKTDKQ
jgi:chemotaxis family two-component system response regulator Rcp1